MLIFKPWVISLIILGVAEVILLGRGVRRWVFGGVILVVFIYLFYLTRAQFLAWAGSDLTKVLVPPFSGIGYFLRYSWTHWWQSFFIGLAMGWIFLRGAQWLNRRRGGMIFYDEEPYLLALGVFLAGQPAWIVYFGLLFTVTVVVNLAGTVRARMVNSGSEAGMTKIGLPRISYYYLWLPVSAVAILLTNLISLEWLWRIFS